MAKKDFTLYWSSLEMYEVCPQKFLWSRGWGDIDVGGGPGRSKPKPLRDSRHHAIMGMVIQKAVELLYNNELWRHPGELPKRIEEIVNRELEYQLGRSYVDWCAAPSRAEMHKVCLDGAMGFLRTMKANRLLGPYAKAEVDLLGYVGNKWNPVGGRADLIVRRDDTGVAILDGKNSKDKGKYTDPDQLRWYALCFYLAFQRLPDRLGFVYYRYPHDPATGEAGVDWVAFTKDDLKGLAQRALDARKGMDRHKFAATPSPSACRFCDYETVCPQRQAQKEANSRNRSRPEMEIGEGYVELDLSAAAPKAGKKK